MSYSGCARICALIPNLVNGASTLTEIPAGVVPASPAIVAWLTSGCSLIEGALESIGYSVPVPSTIRLYGFIQDAEAQYGAYRAEQSRGSTRSGTGDRTRGDGFKAAWDDALEFLTTTDLTRMGMTHSSKIYTAGIEVSDKEIDQDDSDMVQPRFARGIGDGGVSANANSPRTAAS